MGERKNSKERKGVIWASPWPFLYPGLLKKQRIPSQPPASLSSPDADVHSRVTRCWVWGGFHKVQVATAFERKPEQLWVSEIHEITPQIKTFYQLLIAVQTNYILAKLCQWLPRGIIIKFWAWKCVPILSTWRCFSRRNWLLLISAPMMCFA